MPPTPKSGRKTGPKKCASNLFRFIKKQEYTPPGRSRNDSSCFFISLSRPQKNFTYATFFLTSPFWFYIHKTMRLSLFFSYKNIKPTPWCKKNGISPAIVSKYLRGKTKLSPQNAAIISSATKGEVSVLDLLYDETQPGESAKR